MEKRICAIFLLSVVCCMGLSFHPGRYHFISESKDWLAAQQYCRSSYTDLATITDDQDLKDLADVVSYGVQYVHLGLYRSWGWSRSEEDDYKEGEPAFWNWASGEPTDYFCGSMSASGEWHTTDCNTNLNFICYNAFAADISNRFTLGSGSMNWLSAQNYCRNQHTDLARIRNMEENQLLQMMTMGDQQMWIGLTRMTWSWSGWE
ncbi:P-selectin-like [Pholidichthys leucotaenia]